VSRQTYLSRFRRRPKQYLDGGTGVGSNVVSKPQVTVPLLAASGGVVHVPWVVLAETSVVLPSTGSPSTTSTALSVPALVTSIV
jgi:hypothetical protein